jgi:Tfp pilus assembly protein FimT
MAKTHRLALSRVRSREHGYTLLETMIAITIIMTVAAVSVLSLQTVIRASRADEGYDTLLMEMRTARERSIEERKQYIVCFGATIPTGALTPLGVPDAQSVQLFRWDIGFPQSEAVQINKIELPKDDFYQTLAGFPTAAAQVPDGLGNGAVAINFDIGVAGAIPNQVMFLPDGSAHDVNGNYNTGILYVARNNDLFSGRAITLYGASGRIRGWRLQNPGVATWVEQ